MAVTETAGATNAPHSGKQPSCQLEKASDFNEKKG
jgi:hypothetical protein